MATKKVGKAKKVNKSKPVKKLKSTKAKPKKVTKAKTVKKAVAKKIKKVVPKKKVSAGKTTTKKVTKPVSKAKKPTAVKKTTSAPKKQSVSKSAPKLKVIRNEFTPSTTKSKGGPMLASYLVGLNIAPYQEKSSEEYMNERQHNHFRNILAKWKEQLLQEMNRTVHHLQDEAINLPDPNDRASQEEEFSLELRARDRERKLIKKIEETFQKIDEGEYGYCESCGVEIGIRRLEARPTANLCIDCKTLDEIRERQMGG